MPDRPNTLYATGEAQTESADKHMQFVVSRSGYLGTNALANEHQSRIFRHLASVLQLKLVSGDYLKVASCNSDLV